MTGIILPAFTPMEDSLFLTLCARALDSRSPHPILADTVADEIVQKLDYDYGQFHLDANLVINVALRAKKLDEVASGFLARHPDAIGLDLGAGLVKSPGFDDPREPERWNPRLKLVKEILLTREP